MTIKLDDPVARAARADVTKWLWTSPGIRRAVYSTALAACLLGLLAVLISVTGGDGPAWWLLVAGMTLTGAGISGGLRFSRWVFRHEEADAQQARVAAAQARQDRIRHHGIEHLVIEFALPDGAAPQTRTLILPADTPHGAISDAVRSHIGRWIDTDIATPGSFTVLAAVPADYTNQPGLLLVANDDPAGITATVTAGAQLTGESRGTFTVRRMVIAPLDPFAEPVTSPQ